MLNTHLHSRQTGLTLIELIIGAALLGVLMALVVPSFQTWLKNSQIRNAAESVASGLQRARAEAVKLNANVAFTLGAGSAWTITQIDVVPPLLIESRSSHEGSKEVGVVALGADLATPATTITYNGLGGVIANTDGTPAIAQIDFASVGGDRSLRVMIGVGGNSRMCDPNIASGLTACI